GQCRAAKARVRTEWQPTTQATSGSSKPASNRTASSDSILQQRRASASMRSKAAAGQSATCSSMIGTIRSGSGRIRTPLAVRASFRRRIRSRGATLLAGVGALLLIANAMPTPYRDGPPLAHTGGFGEPTCSACHGGRDVNTGSGTVGIDGFPSSYRTDSTYTIVVSIVQADMVLSGFELAIRDSLGNGLGTLGT